jgi:hypothetical protein
VRISLKYKLFLIFTGFYVFLVGLFYLFPLDATSVRVIIGNEVYSWLLHNDFLSAVDSTNINVHINLKHWINLLSLFLFAFLSTLIAEIDARKKPFYNILLQKFGAFLGSLAASFGITYLLIIIISGPGPWGWVGFAVVGYGLFGVGVIFLITRAIVGSWYLEESLIERWVYSIFELSILIITVQILL